MTETGWLLFTALVGASCILLAGTIGIVLRPDQAPVIAATSGGAEVLLGAAGAIVGLVQSRRTPP